jgi:phosphoribosyl 1,2-cyclic phosphodiesterase
VRFASLGSGSEGNALIVQTRDGGSTTTIMIDCGFNQKELERRLNRVGLTTPDLDAIFVTHEHSDHIGGVFRVGRKFDIPLYMTRGTFINHNDALAELARVNIVCAYTPVTFQDLCVVPFTVCLLYTSPSPRDH